MVRLWVGLAALVALSLSGCSVEGTSCGLGRCKTSATCVTIFQGNFLSKAALPGHEIDHNYWCEDACPSGHSCAGKCLEDPIDGTDVVCATDHVNMEMTCPAQLGATVDGACALFSVTACSVDGVVCAPGKVCELSGLRSGTQFGPIAIDVGQGGPLFIDVASLAHTDTANPLLSTALPDGVVPRVNLPTGCN
jgi:hypothetical protein